MNHSPFDTKLKIIDPRIQEVNDLQFQDLDKAWKKLANDLKNNEKIPILPW